MKKNYAAPQLFCDDFAPDTMIASCGTGDCAMNAANTMNGTCKDSELEYGCEYASSGSIVCAWDKSQSWC